jgi:hypothetical protein
MTNDEVQINPLPTHGFDSSVLDVTEDRDIVTVGLVPSPGHAQEIVADIAEDLPELLREHIDDEVSWEIKVVPDPLTGSNVETPQLLDELDEWRSPHGWSYAISVTDLPVRRQERIVIGEASVDRNLAWISVPPLGTFWLRRRVRAAILQMVNELRWGTPRGNPDRQEEEHQHDPDAASQRDRTLDPMISSRVAEHSIPSEDDTTVNVRYLAPRRLGHARLLTGMVYANRPWTLFPSFKTTVATAFATGGYVMVFSTVWVLGNQYAIWRLVLLTLVSMSVLSGWIILSHNLWQPSREAASRYLTSLYNTTTVLTIVVGVIFAYTAVFLLLLSASAVFIPPAILESEIQQPVSPFNYVRVAWMGVSVATIAGAIGAGLEDSEAVRNATFSWRQQNRYEEYKRLWGDEREASDDPGD